MEERTTPAEEPGADLDNFPGELFVEYVRWNRVKNSCGPFSARNKGEAWTAKRTGGRWKWAGGGRGRSWYVLYSYFHKIYTGIPVGQLLLCRRALTGDKGLFSIGSRWFRSFAPKASRVPRKFVHQTTRLWFAYRRLENLILYVLCIPNSVNNIYGNTPLTVISLKRSSRKRRSILISTFTYSFLGATRDMKREIAEVFVRSSSVEWFVYIYFFTMQVDKNV